MLTALATIGVIAGIICLGLLAAAALAIIALVFLGWYMAP